MTREELAAVLLEHDGCPSTLLDFIWPLLGGGGRKIEAQNAEILTVIPKSIHQERMGRVRGLVRKELFKAGGQ